MKPYQRAALALAVLKLETNNTKRNIYDYTQSCYPRISGHADKECIKFFDYDRNTYFEGRFNGGEYRLYDYGHGEYISIKQKSAGSYEGYHYGSGRYYSIACQGNNVSFYDYGTALYYNFA